jgi:ribosomal protein L34E
MAGVGIWSTRKSEHFAKDWKAAHPCADCGKQYPSYVMEFDHIGPKRLTLGYSRHLRKLSEEELRIEIAMCDVVCRNCHAERTHQRLIAKRLAKRQEAY